MFVLRGITSAPCVLNAYLPILLLIVPSHNNAGNRTQKIVTDKLLLYNIIPLDNLN